MYFKLILFAFSFSICFAHSKPFNRFSGSATFLDSNHRKAWNSTFLIYDQTTGIHGTVFLVDKNVNLDGNLVLYFLTNYHVVDDCPFSCVNKKIYLNFSFLIGDRPRVKEKKPFFIDSHIKFLHYYTDLDLAIISVEVRNTPKFQIIKTLPLAHLESCKVTEGEKLTTIGFPYLSYISKRYGFTYLKSDLVVIKKRYHRFKASRFYEYTGYINGVHSAPGGSGGPIVNKNGLVVGLMESITTGNNTFTNFIHCKIFGDVLDKINQLKN